MDVFDYLHRKRTLETLAPVQQKPSNFNQLIRIHHKLLCGWGDRALANKVVAHVLPIAASSALLITTCFATALQVKASSVSEPPILISQTFDAGSSVGLQLGDNGDAVADLQQRLANAGFYTGVIDGDFGPQTEAAVIQFQQARGLVADGIVGSATDAALRNAGSSTTAPTPTQTPPLSDDSGFLQLNSSGPRVSTLQTRLRDIGYYTGPISGVFGAQTEAAVIRFQQANGLTADGIVGPSTEAALNTVGTAPPPQVSQPPAQPVVTVPPSPPPTSSPVVQPAPPTTVGQTEPIGRSEGRFSVIELQRRLQARGFNPGTIDGVFGAQTRAAIAEAQRAYGLTQNDILNGRF